jgi:hypothetical protein
LHTGNSDGGTYEQAFSIRPQGCLFEFCHGNSHSDRRPLTRKVRGLRQQEATSLAQTSPGVSASSMGWRRGAMRGCSCILHTGRGFMRRCMEMPGALPY